MATGPLRTIARLTVSVRADRKGLEALRLEIERLGRRLGVTVADVRVRRRVRRRAGSGS